MKRRFLPLLLAMVMVLSLLPAITAEIAEPTIKVEKTTIGNTGAVLDVKTDGMRGKTTVTAVSSDESIADVSVSGNTVTVTGRPGAVGIAKVTVTVTDKEGNTRTSVQDVPVGYTAFFFEGNSVTVVAGADTKYEVTGMNIADEADHDLTISTDASGNTVYTNNSDATLVVSIKKAGGAYVFAGTCTNGSINVKKEATGNTWLLLNGLDMTSSYTSPITIKKDSSAKAVITALAGTENTLTDAALNDADTYGPTADGGNGSNQYYAESAVIKAKANTTVYINGEGTLNLNCNSKNAIKTSAGSWIEIADLTLNITSVKSGISVEDSLEILSGTIGITAQANDGIKAEDDTEQSGKISIAGGDITVNAADEGICACGSVNIFGGTIDITCSGDGIKAENAEETTGDVYVCGGDITVVTQQDGIQAAGSATFRGGSVNITARGGSSNTSYNKDSDPSAKGIKAGAELIFDGGTFTVNSADDALHSNGNLTVTGGTFTCATTDDGVHADYCLTLGEQGGNDDDINLTVTTCYEGIEGANINIVSGNYTVWTNEDCVNAANSDLGGYAFTLRIFGGSLYCYGSSGDGLDSNGEFTICGGHIEVYSPGNGNAALDSDGTMSLIGGTTMAIGASDMVETPSYGVYVRFGSSGGWGGGSSGVSFSNGDTVAVYNSSNTKLFEGTVRFKTSGYTGTCVIFSCPSLSSGQTYKLYKNGSQVTTATATGNSGGSTPSIQEGAATWHAVGELSTAYARVTSMTAGVGAVITNTGSSYALTGGSTVSGTSVSVSTVTGGYSITNVSEANTWYRNASGKLYCTINGTNYYLAYNKSSSGWSTTYTIKTTTDAETAPSWTVSASGNYARISTTPASTGGDPGGPGGPGQSTTVYLAASGSSFTLSTSASSVYVYSPDTALASLTGTLDYIINVDAGQTVTESQIKANASILFKSSSNATQQTLAWTDSRVSTSWSPALDCTKAGVYDFNVYVLDTLLGSIRVIALSSNNHSTAPEPPAYEIPGWPSDDPTPTPEPTPTPGGLLGDVNLDGSVDVADALLVMRCAMGIITLPDDVLYNADYDGNGVIEITDAILIMRVAMRAV